MSNTGDGSAVVESVVCSRTLYRDEESRRWRAGPDIDRLLTRALGLMQSSAKIDSAVDVSSNPLPVEAFVQSDVFQVAGKVKISSMSLSWTKQ